MIFTDHPHTHKSGGVKFFSLLSLSQSTSPIRGCDVKSQQISNQMILKIDDDHYCQQLITIHCCWSCQLNIGFQIKWIWGTGEGFRQPHPRPLSHPPYFHQSFRVIGFLHLQNIKSFYVHLRSNLKLIHIFKIRKCTTLSA